MNGTTRSNHWFLEALRKLFGYQFPPCGQRLQRFLIGKSRTEFETELFPGVQVPMNLRDNLHEQTYWFGRRNEFPTGHVFEGWCRDCDAFFDIGSNYGFYTWWMASAYPNLALHMFEPDPTHHARIESVISRNNLANVHLHKIGLADHSATLTFTLAKNSGGASFGQPLNLEPTGSIEAQVTTFDRFREANGLQWPTTPRWVAKIDVEGFDFKVLQGMKIALEKRAFKGISVEASDDYLGPSGDSIFMIESFLQNYGFNRHQPKKSRFWTGSSVCENRFYTLPG